MSVRIAMAELLLRAGRFLRTLPVAVMSPDDLVGFNRRHYARASEVEAWSSGAIVASGLTDAEEAVLDAIPIRSGRMLVLGAGGGREAIPFAKAGWDVTALDFVPEMLQRTCRAAEAHGLRITPLLQEVSRVAVAPESFDVVWLFACMYSSLPGRARRVRVLRRVRDALRPGGFFACQFHWNPSLHTTVLGDTARRCVALLALGNFAHEPGDILWQDAEFIHVFRSEAALRSEFAAGGFEVLSLRTRPGNVRGEALLRRPEGS